MPAISGQDRSVEKNGPSLSCLSKLNGSIHNWDTKKSLVELQQLLFSAFFQINGFFQNNASKLFSVQPFPVYPKMSWQNEKMFKF